ncbi:MAG: hypothetical protein LBV52_00310, partial [Spirochaetaceae bacterium]|nr:hypothetical protein [Spirochaetaceae bacterium]
NEYLAWVVDFDIPFTNNLSERSLRDAKSKMKISGQFQNEKTASYYANIKSYLETCNRKRCKWILRFTQTLHSPPCR